MSDRETTAAERNFRLALQDADTETPEGLLAAGFTLDRLTKAHDILQRAEQGQGFLCLSCAKQVSNMVAAGENLECDECLDEIRAVDVFACKQEAGRPDGDHLLVCEPCSWA